MIYTIPLILSSLQYPLTATALLPTLHITLPLLSISISYSFPRWHMPPAPHPRLGLSHFKWLFLGRAPHFLSAGFLCSEIIKIYTECWITGRPTSQPDLIKISDNMLGPKGTRKADISLSQYMGGPRRVRGYHQVANDNWRCIKVINWQEPSRKQFSHSQPSAIMANDY